MHGASIERSRQWRAMKMRKVQFQPVPVLLEPVPVGHVMAFEWQTGGVLSGGSQLVSSHSGVGVVTQVQVMGQYLRIKVHIPCTSPYGRGHWLWHRLDGVPPGVPVLPNDVRAVFFKPGEVPGATPDWRQLERVF